jgi:hypothetical protein
VSVHGTCTKCGRPRLVRGYDGLNSLISWASNSSPTEWAATFPWEIVL